MMQVYDKEYVDKLVDVYDAAVKYLYDIEKRQGLMTACIAIEQGENDELVNG